MRKTTFFAALLGFGLFFGAMVPQAEAQRWRARGYNYAPSYYAPSYYAPTYYAPSYYAPSYYAPYSAPVYTAPAYTAPVYSAPAYGTTTSYYPPVNTTTPYYYAPYSTGYYNQGWYPYSPYRGFVRTPWVGVGW